MKRTRVPRCGLGRGRRGTWRTRSAPGFHESVGHLPAAKFARNVKTKGIGDEKTCKAIFGVVARTGTWQRCHERRGREKCVLNIVEAVPSVTGKCGRGHNPGTVFKEEIRSTGGAEHSNKDVEGIRTLSRSIEEKAGKPWLLVLAQI